MSNIFYNKYTRKIIDDINEISDSIFDDVKKLDKYPQSIAKQVLKILIQYACLGQNCGPIEIGSKKIGEIVNREWLIQHFLEVADENINFSDGWEYRRLVELVTVYIPELKREVLKRGENSVNEEIREVVEDFQDR